jgi:hypothetical protein
MELNLRDGGAPQPFNAVKARARQTLPHGARRWHSIPLGRAEPRIGPLLGAPGYQRAPSPFPFVRRTPSEY